MHFHWFYLRILVNINYSMYRIYNQSLEKHASFPRTTEVCKPSLKICCAIKELKLCTQIT